MSGGGEGAAPRVSAVVVNYNGTERMRGCLEALLRDDDPAREVLVVDNASGPTSRAIVQEVAARHPELIVLWSERNLGYAGGVNLALGRARGEYIAVLNMDMDLAPGWLAPLVAFLDTHPAVGAVNPLIALADGERINALGQDVHVTGLGFNRGLGRPLASAGRAPVPVSGLHGSAFVIRRRVLAELGGMDASGFLYHEDVNLSWLLRLAGHEIYCLPESIVRHDYFLSMYPAKFQLLERNRLAMLLAYLRPATLLALAPILALSEGLAWGYYCLLRGPAFARAKLASYGWILRARRQIGARRRVAESARRRTDREVLRELRWAYAWDQFATLGRERGPSRRQPAGGLPTEATGG